MKWPISFSLAILFFALNTVSQAEITNKYSELEIKDLDEMSGRVEALVRKAKQAAVEQQRSGDVEAGDTEAVEYLRKALVLILSRPNKDNMLADLLPPVRRELGNYNAYPDTLSSVASEAMDGMQNSKLKAPSRATYFFVLENLLSELRPDAQREDFKKIIVKIRDAKLEIPKEVKRELKLTSMYRAVSPSAIAQEILDKKTPSSVK